MNNWTFLVWVQVLILRPVQCIVVISRDNKSSQILGLQEPDSLMPTNHVVEQIKGLKIIYSNIDTYLNKREELQALIGEINPDIICLTEILSKLKGIDFNPCEYDIPGYQAFYGPHRKRGTAIYVKMQLKSSSKQEPLIFHEFESVWAEVRLKDRDKLLLGCIYRSPNTDEENNNKLLEMLEVNGPAVKANASVASR